MRFFKIYQALWLGIAIITLVTFAYQVFSKKRLNNDDYIILMISIFSFTTYAIKQRNKSYFKQVYQSDKDKEQN